MIYHGDLFDVLPTLEAESIDACCTDPPYGIGFMGRTWDTFKPGEAEKRIKSCDPIVSDNPNLKGRKRAPASSPSAVEYDRSLKGQHEFQAWTEAWAREVWRVLKPGAHLLVCGAPRSFHRMTCGLEDAGFEIRDCLSWNFGQGFPKSLNTGEGRGTALKPAWEPIILARKPFRGNLKDNLAKHGTGAINIDACRIEAVDGADLARYNAEGENGWKNSSGGPNAAAIRKDSGLQPLGRWPANVLLDEISAQQLDREVGDCSSPWIGNPRGVGAKGGQFFGGGDQADVSKPEYADSGGPSRYFYVAKPSREERDAGIYGEPENGGGQRVRARNSHPT